MTTLKNEQLNTFLSEITSKLDMLTERVNSHQDILNTHNDEIKTMSTIVINHDNTINEMKIKQNEFETRMEANTSYIAEEFSSIKDFFKDIIQNKEFKKTLTIEEHQAIAITKNAKRNSNNITNDQSKISNQTITTCSVYDSKAYESLVKDVSKPIVTLSDKLKQILGNHTNTTQ
ncbi:hypothetical protein BpHYR1_035239 [Brachionus plicatilis]|uniref:Uncharacterized protein n=1 Tax=Brachionus plicatilis TaxID=10195 RepID=A0A3M7R373_BRAPC|nr:hypothetical protein BpHYR1_035239 [Brachionus plicatilis]